MNVFYFMSGSVSGYAKKHYFLGTPECRRNLRRKKFVKILPKQKAALKTIKPL